MFMAALSLANFTLVVYGFGTGELGFDSNNSIGDGSLTVFRARSTTFASLTWFALLLALEMLNPRLSFFKMVPDTPQYVLLARSIPTDHPSPYTQWARSLMRNKLLLFSILFGYFSVFPIIYIPVLNTTVFKHAPISWEWALVFIASFLFVGGIEAWKYGKRAFFRSRAASREQGDGKEYIRDPR